MPPVPLAQELRHSTLKGLGYEARGRRVSGCRPLAASNELLTGIPPKQDRRPKQPSPQPKNAPPSTQATARGKPPTMKSKKQTSSEALVRKKALFRRGVTGGMHSHALVTFARPGWFDEVRVLQPGAHVAVFASNPDVGIEGRLVGLELRDTLLVLRSGPLSSFIFLFRKPVEEQTVADQMAASGTGAINVDACRVGFNSDADRKQALPGSMPKANQSIGTFQTRDRTTERPEDAQNSAGRWPSNVVLVHGPECRQEGTKRVRGANPPELGSTAFAGDAGGASRFYPQLADDDALRRWVTTLITPV